MIYYTVYDSDGNKIADCGNEKDAKWLADVRDGTYKTNRMKWKETVNVKPLKLELPCVTIAGQEISIQQKLPNTQQEPLKL